MATQKHSQFHAESVESANASGAAIDEYLAHTSVQDAGLSTAIATDEGYSALRWLTAKAIGLFAGLRRSAELGQVIGFMAEDKSNDWSDEITTLESVEVELTTLRDQVETYNANVGPLDSIVLQSRYARLGRFIAVSLGANEEWDNDSLTEGAAELWKRMGDDHPLGDQDGVALKHWRALADRLSIEHDGEEEEACAEDGCENSLDDGEGYDGYCGEHADQREAAGTFDSEEIPA